MGEAKLNKFDAFMLIVCGIMFADAIASNTSAGVPALSWWLIIGLLYMIPTGFIIGELTGHLPGEGGIYVWIYEGMGPKWAARASWLFFACGLFIPVSAFVMFADIFFALVYPEADLIVRIILAMALIWVLAWVSCKPMAEAKWVTNTAGIIKLGIFALCLLAGILFIAQGNAMANDVSLGALVPTLDEGLVFLPIILYCCTGMELASASAEQMDNPSKMLPKVVVGVAVMAVILNILASLGMLFVIPLDEIDLDMALIDLFATAFGSEIVYYVVGILFLFTLFAQNLSWIVGGNRGACESAKEGDLPAILGRETKGGQPIGAILITCIAGSVLLVVYALFAETAADLFFALLQCGVIASLIPYVFMFISYQNLKRRGEMDPGKYDGFRAPAGVVFSWIAQILQVATLLLMIYVPGYGWNPDVLTNAGGAILMLATGEVAIWWAARNGGNGALDAAEQPESLES